VVLRGTKRKYELKELYTLCSVSQHDTTVMVHFILTHDFSTESMLCQMMALVMQDVFMHGTSRNVLGACKLNCYSATELHLLGVMCCRRALYLVIFVLIVYCSRFLFLFGYVVTEELMFFQCTRDLLLFVHVEL